MNELFTLKELADKLKRSVRYVVQMRSRGFPMPGGTATLSEARDWLSKNPGLWVANKTKKKS